jgi:hypothetical protein
MRPNLSALPTGGVAVYQVANGLTCRDHPGISLQLRQLYSLTCQVIGWHGRGAAVSDRGDWNPATPTLQR